MTSIKHYRQKGAVRSSLLSIIVILLIAAAIIWMLVLTKPKPQAELQAPNPVRVTLATVVKRTIQPQEKVTGRLHPAKTAQIRFEVAGQVQEKLVNPGMLASKGAVLMKLSSADFRDELQQADAELIIEQKTATRDQDLLALARNNLTLQQKEEQRLEKLVQRSLIAQSQLDETRQRVFDLQAEVARLEFSVATSKSRIQLRQSQRDMAQRDVSRTALLAPFAGVVNEVFVEQGDFVEPNQVAVTLVDNTNHELHLDVRGELIAALSLEQQIAVSLNGEALIGRVSALQIDPDPNTNTHQVRILLREDRIQAGMLAVATIPLIEQENKLIVPVSAVATLQGSYFVFVYADEVIRKTPVKIGKRVGNDYLVLNGLQQGEEIVARDVVSLSHNQTVVVE